MQTNLKIAIQKSGRLNESSLRLLKECGIKVRNGKNKLKARAENFPLEVLYLRDDDIPKYLEDGVADIGIVGENVALEKGCETVLKERLGFAKCRLSLAIPKEIDYSGTAWFEGKRIATSYPKLLSNFLKEAGISAELHEISGSVEIAPGIGLADAVCDIVSTGSTLFSNGLKEVESVFRSEAILLSSPVLSEEKNALLEQLIFRIQAVKSAQGNRYILLNAPREKLEEISKLLPGMRSPTVMPLADPNWCSLHSVVKENDFWEVIDQLKSAGAEGILIVPIEKMIL